MTTCYGSEFFHGASHYAGQPRGRHRAKCPEAKRGPCVPTRRSTHAWERGADPPQEGGDEMVPP